jgi:hypothetical protein
MVIEIAPCRKVTKLESKPRTHVHNESLSAGCHAPLSWTSVRVLANPIPMQLVHLQASINTFHSCNSTRSAHPANNSL